MASLELAGSPHEDLHFQQEPPPGELGAKRSRDAPLLERQLSLSIPALEDYDDYGASPAASSTFFAAPEAAAAANPSPAKLSKSGAKESSGQTAIKALALAHDRVLDGAHDTRMHIAAVQTYVAGVNKQLKELKTQVAEATRIIKKDTAQIAELELTVDVSRKTIVQFQKGNESLRKELETYRARYEDATRQIEVLKMEALRAPDPPEPCKDCDRLEAHIAKLNERNNENEVELGKLKEWKAQTLDYFRER